MITPVNEELFWSKVCKTAGCWLWAASTRGLGYTHPEKVARGEANSAAKLTAAQARDIRSRAGQTQKAIALEYGVSDVLISKIRSGKIWAHVAMEHGENDGTSHAVLPV